MTPIGHSPSFVIPELRDPAIRLRTLLRADLLEIRDGLDGSNWNDQLTQDIRRWTELFLRALSSARDVEEVMNNFCEMLREILVDPITQTPLDEEAYLGSDGHTYDHKSLRLYRASVSEPYLSRSPLNKDDETPFTVDPQRHPNVELLVKWQKRRDAYIPSERIEELYAELVAQNREPRIPTPRNEAIRKIQESALRRRVQRESELNDHLNRSRERVQQIVRSAFSPLQAGIREFSQEFSARCDDLEHRMEEQERVLHQALGQLQTRHTELQQEQSDLEAQIEQVAGDISEAKKDDVRLALEINKTRQAINERNQGWLGGLVFTLGSIGVCAFATWALQGAMLSAGISTVRASVTPLSGGAKLGFSLAF